MIEDDEEKKHFYNLGLENLDLYNYIIKYSIFRNAECVTKILRIIDELDISEIMKAKIKGRPDLGKDERYGRRIIFELNKNYPVIMSPLLGIEELRAEVIKALGYYDIELEEQGAELEIG